MESSASKQIVVPYNIGGFDTGSNFYNKITRTSDQKTAGNIRRSVQSSCAGIDCSGYISRAYGFSYKFAATTVPSHFYQISWAQLSQGDIVNAYTI